jgi:hypothetical protein
MDALPKKCTYCGSSPLPPRHYRCCEHCSPLASTLFKRRLRAESRRLGAKYWLDHYLKLAPDDASALRVYREAVRIRVRRHRERRRLLSGVTNPTGHRYSGKKGDQ